MMDLSESGVEYRYEDLIQMGKDGVNSEFGHKQKPYDIFEWKGGVYCRHGFVRNIYIYAPGGELAEDVQVKEIEGAWDDVMRRVGNNFEVEQPGFEIVAPIDTPSRGSIKYG
jgi:hypothetical protein